MDGPSALIILSVHVILYYIILLTIYFFQNILISIKVSARFKSDDRFKIT